jgi:DNA-directed RNA polymerase subunit RPC12/RpoP
MKEQKSQIRCALCGKTLLSKEKETDVIVEMIDDKRYTFHTDDCVLMFKKFREVYGNDFF